MNNQKWNDPGAGTNSSEANVQSERDCLDYILPQVFAARNFSDVFGDFDLIKAPGGADGA